MFANDNPPIQQYAAQGIAETRRVILLVVLSIQARWGAVGAFSWCPRVKVARGLSRFYIPFTNTQPGRGGAGVRSPRLWGFAGYYGARHSLNN